MMERRSHVQATNQPGRASAEDGVVLLDGPDGIAVTMTPEAAAGTALSLQRAAAQALLHRPAPGPRNADGSPAA